MISFDEAFAIVAGAVRPLGSESVAIDDAHGRVVAEAVVAATDSPQADVSTMDGYAVREAELPSLRVIGESFPGAGFAGAMGPGECVRIFTGAALPEGADRVIVQEIVRRDGDRVTINGPYAARYIRASGSDFRKGDVLLRAGRILDPHALVAAAAADVGAVAVWRRPRVAVLSTGDELAEPGQAGKRPGSIPDSITPGVAALAEEWGGAVVSRRRVGDDPGAMESAARDALGSADVVVVSGGASVGDRDFAKPVFAALNIEMLFAGVAMKPGRPVWFGRNAGKFVLGLPGNPTSAMVTARLLLAPLLAGLTGRDPVAAADWQPAQIATSLEPEGDRESFLRGRWGSDGVEALGNQDSGAQHALADADVLIRRRPGAPACDGASEVDILIF